MNDRRWESLDDADKDFVEQALHAGREELPEATRMRLSEARLGRALEQEALPSTWWRRARWHAVAGLALVAFGALGTVSPSRSTPSRPVAPAEPAAVARTEPAPSGSARDSDSAPDAVSLSVEALPPAEPLTPKAATATSRHEAMPRSRSVAPAAPPSGANDELALLEEASRALDASPQRALALTDEHAKRFGAPKFAQERERLAVVALVLLGRREDARRRADAFEAAYPESAHLKRVRELVSP